MLTKTAFGVVSAQFSEVDLSRSQAAGLRTENSDFKEKWFVSCCKSATITTINE